MEDRHRYFLNVEWTRNRSGVAEADHVVQRVDFSAPVEFQGEEDKWTPEHFFLAALASCFVTTFSAIAEYSKFPVTQLTVTASGTLAKAEGGMRMTEVELKPVLKIEDETLRGKAMVMLEKAERGCFISRSVTSRVTVHAVVEVLNRVLESVEADA